MTEILGFSYAELHWHFWIGVGVALMTNLIVLMNPQLYHSSSGKLSIIFGVIGLAVIFYFGLGVLFSQLGCCI